MLTPANFNDNVKSKRGRPTNRKARIPFDHLHIPRNIRNTQTVLARSDGRCPNPKTSPQLCRHLQYWYQQTSLMHAAPSRGSTTSFDHDCRLPLSHHTFNSASRISMAHDSSLSSSAYSCCSPPYCSHASSAAFKYFRAPGVSSIARCARVTAG